MELGELKNLRYLILYVYKTITGSDKDLDLTLLDLGRLPLRHWVLFAEILLRKMRVSLPCLSKSGLGN